MDSIEEEFNDAMMQVYWRAKEKCSYDAKLYFAMLSEHRGMKTAKMLLAGSKAQYGFTKLWECGCLDITVECLVLNPRYQRLFEENQLLEARQRLREYGFDPGHCEQDDCGKKED